MEEQIHSALRLRHAKLSRWHHVSRKPVYLLDARSGLVTGQCLFVCGGMTVGAAGA
jgi:hypothetical protein